MDFKLRGLLVLGTPLLWAVVSSMLKRVRSALQTSRDGLKVEV